jgi:hypothetical protein
LFEKQNIFTKLFVNLRFLSNQKLLGYTFQLKQAKKFWQFVGQHKKLFWVTSGWANVVQNTAFFSKRLYLAFPAFIGMVVVKHCLF